MPQDWFAENAPSGNDWFKANAPATAAPGNELRAQSTMTRLTRMDPVNSKMPLSQSIPNFVGDIGAAGINTLAHPLDTIKGVASSFLHPGDTLKSLYQGLNTNPGVTVAQNIGQTAAMGGVAELAGGVAKTVLPRVIPAASRVALLGKTPAGAYESAMKVSPAVSAADRASMVQTGLDNAIPVSKAGVEKLADRIDTLNQAIKDQIDSDPTRPIDPNAVATRADLAKAKFSKQVNASGDLNAIESSKQQFLREQGAPVDAQGNLTRPAPDMKAIDAQEMKQGTYRVLKGKFGEQGSAAVEAQKSLARGLKEEIATQFPELSKLNAQESSLLELQPALERAVNRISNHQVIGIGTPVAGAAAKAVSGSSVVGGVAMTLKAVLDNPAVKSRLAIALSKANKIPITGAMDKINSYSRALGPIVSVTQRYSSDGSPSQSTQGQP